jgi:hypothetical protein
MTAYNKFNSFVEALAEKKHDLSTDTLKVALSNSAPDAALDSLLADITTVSVANLGDVTLSVTSSSQTSGTYKLAVADKTMTASGAVGPFRYIIIYNDTPVTDKPLICFFDYGSSVTLASGDTFKLDFGTELFSLA